MTETAECKTPLLDLLDDTPPDAVAWYEHSGTHHQQIPYGRQAQEAAAEIRSLRDRLTAAEQRVRELENEIANGPTAADMKAEYEAGYTAGWTDRDEE